MEMEYYTNHTIPSKYTQLSTNSLISIIIYSILFVLGAIGNLSVFYTMWKKIYVYRMRTRITFLIFHLSLADCIVTFFLIPSEIFWKFFILWYGGNWLCKLCSFVRTFGLYLSSGVLICISLDRYFAIIQPLRMINGRKTVKWMIISSWIFAGVASIPQAIIFRVGTHQNYASVQQCVTMFHVEQESEAMIIGEIFYNGFSLFALYFAPLIVIIFSYAMIILEITKKTKQQNDILNDVSDSLKQRINRSTSNNANMTSGTISNKISNNEPIIILNNGQISRKICEHPNGSTTPKLTSIKSTNTNSPTSQGRNGLRVGIRLSDNGVFNIRRARNTTLRLTLVIVIAFVLCATPYVFMTLWYMIDRQSAREVNPIIQEIFFIMVVTNSIVNPLIYGSYQLFGNSKSYKRNVNRGSGNVGTKSKTSRGFSLFPFIWPSGKCSKKLSTTTMSLNTTSGTTTGTTSTMTMLQVPNAMVMTADPKQPISSKLNNYNEKNTCPDKGDSLEITIDECTRQLEKVIEKLPQNPQNPINYHHQNLHQNTLEH